MEAAARTADRPPETATDDTGGGGGDGGDPAIQAMRDRLATPDGIAAYRQRSQIAGRDRRLRV